MPAMKVDDDAILAAWGRSRNTTSVATALGLSTSQARKRLRALGVSADMAQPAAPRDEFHITPLPDDDIPIEDLVAHRIKQFKKKAAHREAAKLVRCTVNIEGPIGLLVFGDPHIDDDGCDLERLRAHSDLTHIPAVWGCNIGDTTNNWVGRLARLYADQGTSAKQAWALAEWFVKRTRWLFLIGGNHDAWSGEGDPLKWICRQQDALYQSSEVRLGLAFPNGREVIVNARHDFAGRSQWNPAHGVMKAATMGVRDHVLMCGHKHVSGYAVLKDPESGRAIHTLQIASYKVYDRYAIERGFRDQNLSPAAFLVIDPALPETHPDLVKVFWDPAEGVRYLNWRRSQA